MSPRIVQDEYGGTSVKKPTRVTPEDLGNALSHRGGRNYNNRHANTTMKNGRKTNRGKGFGALNSSVKKSSDPMDDLYIKPWKIANHEGQEVYNDNVQVDEQPITRLDDKDYIKRLKFE